MESKQLQHDLELRLCLGQENSKALIQLKEILFAVKLHDLCSLLRIPPFRRKLTFPILSSRRFICLKAMILSLFICEDHSPQYAKLLASLWSFPITCFRTTPLNYVSVHTSYQHSCPSGSIHLQNCTGHVHVSLIFFRKSGLFSDGYLKKYNWH